MSIIERVVRTHASAHGSGPPYGGWPNPDTSFFGQKVGTILPASSGYKRGFGRSNARKKLSRPAGPKRPTGSVRHIYKSVHKCVGNKCVDEECECDCENNDCDCSCNNGPMDNNFGRSFGRSFGSSSLSYGPFSPLNYSSMIGNSPPLSTYNNWIDPSPYATVPQGGSGGLGALGATGYEAPSNYNNLFFGRNNRKNRRSRRNSSHKGRRGRRGSKSRKSQKSSKRRRRRRSRRLKKEISPVK